MRAFRTAVAAAAGLLLAGSAALAQPRASFEARRDIPGPAGVAAKNFGGLSGIDYDPTLKRYVVISDDTAQHGPSRFYEATIALRQARMRITATRVLRNDAGALFPVRGAGGEQADGESIRVDPVTGYRLWSSEGDINAGFAPALRWADLDGGFRSRFPLPPALIAGVRHNFAYEGVTFTPRGDLWVAPEAPPTQDGPLPTAQAGTLIRLTRLDRFGAIQRQVAYPIDPVWKATPGKRFELGVSEILWLDDNRLLVLERAGVEIEGVHWGFHCRVYLADLSRAQDVSTLASLSGADVRLASKTLLIDFDAVPGGPVGNVEGMAWAPKSRFSPARLVFVTDNNFDADWASQLLVFKFRP
jgi:hypothetical protein